MHSHDDDDLEPLRRVRSDVPPASSESLNRGRAALLERAAGPVAQAKPATPRRRARWALAGTAVAAVTAGALVLGNVVGFGPAGGGASAEARDVLAEAALASIGTVDPVVGPGQYLRIVTESEYPTFGHLDETNAGDWTASLAYIVPGHDEVYIPADRSEEWVWVRAWGAPTRFYGEGAEELAARNDDGERTETVRGEAGNYYGTPAPTGEDLPTDGAALLQHFIDSDNGGSNSIEENLFERITDLLRSGDVTSEVRSASYEALSMIDGVEVVADAATVNGRIGVALARRDPSREYRREIVIDPATGAMIGEREVALDQYASIPAGTVTSWTSVTTSVVDEAP